MSHAGKIPRGLPVLAWLLAAACGAPRAATMSAPPPAPAPTEPLRADQVFVLEAPGVSAEDTVAVLSGGAARVIYLRRAAPDNTVFARLVFPPGALMPAAGQDSVRLTLRPVPGLFGLDLETEGGFAPGAHLTFSYPIHFGAPADAIARYGSELALERALFIGRRRADGRYEPLPSIRPGSDLLQAALTGAGRYLVLAPR